MSILKNFNNYNFNKFNFQRKIREKNSRLITLYPGIVQKI